MRDLTKSLTSYTWAMSVFGMQQMLNLMGLGGGGQSSRATQAFTKVTEATSNELSDTMRAVFRSGDTLQRGMVDLFLAPLNFGNWCGASGDTAGGGGAGRGWADTAARAAAAGADVIGAAAGSTARAAQRTADATGAQARTAPPASDPSIGWGPMPR